MTTVYTIGFAGKSLEAFVGLLREAGVTMLIDVRLRPSSQLSGFARGGDLQYVLEHYERIKYVHAANLAPTDAILDGVRKSKDWAAYLEGFTALMRERKMVAELHRLVGAHERVALLCSEAKATTCHRGVLAAAYAKAHRAEVVDL